MAKKLLVRTPQTNNGTTLVYDDKKQPVYKESIVELAAKKGLESINAKLPSHLRHEFSVIEVEEGEKGSTVEELKKKLASLEQQSQIVDLQAKIDELELKLKASTQTPAADASNSNLSLALSKDGKADAGISIIGTLETIDAVNAFIAGEERKTVVDAANARIEQLTPKA